MNNEMDLSLLLKLRLELLIKEYKAGEIEAKWKAQAIANKVALEYSLPQAIEFYNALNDSDPVYDLSWTNLVDPKKDKHPAFMDVGVPCNECCHRMVNAAYSYVGLPLEMVVAYLIEAKNLAEDSDVRISIQKAMDNIIEGKDNDTILSTILLKLDSLISVHNAEQKQ